MIINKQVNIGHYTFANYLTLERWISYYNQIKGVNDLVRNKREPTILEIGVGDGSVSSKLSNLGYIVTTVDIDPNLNPDIVSSLPDLSELKNKKYDCVLCSEVLEHLRFEDVEKSLIRLNHISDYLVCSVPQKGFTLSFSFKPWIFKAKTFYVSLPIFKFFKHKFNGEHYWELDSKEVTVGNFRKIVRKAGWKILEDFRVPENPYHHFYILQTQHV